MLFCSVLTAIASRVRVLGPITLILGMGRQETGFSGFPPAWHMLDSRIPFGPPSTPGSQLSQHQEVEGRNRESKENIVGVCRGSPNFSHILNSLPTVSSSYRDSDWGPRKVGSGGAEGWEAGGWGPHFWGHHQPVWRLQTDSNLGAPWG